MPLLQPGDFCLNPIINRKSFKGFKHTLKNWAPPESSRENHKEVKSLQIIGQRILYTEVCIMFLSDGNTFMRRNQMMERESITLLYFLFANKLNIIKKKNLRLEHI